MILRKGVEIKDVTDKGHVIVKFATLNVIDKDGDVTLPGFFGKGQAAIMLPAHDWKHIPLGKGPLREAGDEAIAELLMNLDVAVAKDWHSWLLFDMKNGRPLQEYSYGFTILDGGASDGGEVNGQKAYRTLRPTPEGGPGCLVHEVSPVVVGAGNGTGTLAAKGVRLADELEATMIAVENINLRAKSLAELRAKEGRGLSAASSERIRELKRRLIAADQALSPLLADDELRRAAVVELGRALQNGLGL